MSRSNLQMNPAYKPATFTPAECREIVARAVAMGTMSYPGGAKEPPPLIHAETFTEMRARQLGMTLEEFRAYRSAHDKKRRAKVKPGGGKA